MSINRRVPIVAWTIAIATLGSCGQPTAVNKGPPVPPPEPVVEAKPAPPMKPEPDPYETAVREIVAIFQKYDALYAQVRDEASGDKAVEEIGHLTKRLRELAAEMAKMPYRPGQDQQTLALQAELNRLGTAQLGNTDMQRVLADPDLQLKFITAHQTFASEGIGAIGQALLSRQQAAQPPEQKQPAVRPSKP
jgi:hypothetical protein